MPQKLSRTAVARSARTKARSQAQADANVKSKDGKAKDKENDKGKGKEKEEEGVEEEKVEGDMDVDSPPGPPPIIPETKEDEQLRARQLARMLVPDPSRGLRRLPCTPRFRPRVSVAGEEHHEDDEDEDEDDDEEEGEEDRTIMAPLSHRFTHRVGTLYTVRDTLVSMFHTVEAHRALLKVCGRLHMNIHPPELHAYYRASDGRVVGVLNDFDDAVTTASKTWTQMSDAQREEARRVTRERDRARRRAIEKLGVLRGGD